MPCKSAKPQQTQTDDQNDATPKPKFAGEGDIDDSTSVSQAPPQMNADDRLRAVIDRITEQMLSSLENEFNPRKR